LLSILRANVLFFSPSYRPMGGLFYRSLFAAFGFHPLPFRIAFFLFLTVNLGLSWRIAELVTGSQEVAGLSTLIGAFHPRLVDLYWSTGTIYDVLCFTFFYAALCLYIEIRNRGRVPRGGAALLILVFFVCALNSKEIAVGLPPLMLAYELLFHRGSPRDMLRQARLPLIAAVLTAPYIWGKLLPGSLLTQFDRYHPDMSFSRFLSTYASYLRELLYVETWLTPVSTGVLLLALLLAALLIRSRALVFSWCLAVVAALPIALIPPRTAFEFYIPLTGWTLYIAIVLVLLRTKILGRLERPVYGLLTFLAVLCLLLRAHRIQRQRMGGPELLGQAVIRRVAQDLDRHHVVFPQGERVLVVNDPFTPQRYELLLLLRLYADDPSLEVDNAPTDDCTYQIMLRWDGSRLDRVRNGPCIAVSPCPRST
jgi:hypothetical protein